MKEQKKIFKDKKFLKEVAIILIVGIIVNALCFLMSTIYSKAENVQYFPFESGYNENNINVNQSFIDEQMSNGAFFIRCYSDANSSYPNRMRYVVLTDIELTSSTQVRLYGEILSGYGGSAFALYWDNPNALLSYKVNYYLDWGDGRDIVSSSYDTNTLRPFYNISSAIGSNNVYYSKYPIPLNSINNDVFLITVPSEPINPGEFTDLPGLDEILNDLTNSYTPDFSPVFPNIDTNKTDLENEKSFFETLGSSITSSFNNLGNSLKTWFNNLMSKMIQGFNSVSQNIHNGFATLMANIKDFFGPKLDFIIDKFNYLTEEFSSEDLSTNLNNAAFSSDFLSLITTVSSFSSSLTSGTEPSSCSFTLDFSNSYYNFGVCEFSLDWILPFRSLIRLIVGCLVIYSLIISILTSLNTYIGGTSSINDDI